MSLLSYSYDVLIKYQIVNNVFPKCLTPFCFNKTPDKIVPNLNKFQEIEEIIKTISNGENPNSVLFKNYVKFYVNSIHNNNYYEYLDKLKKLEYSTKENVHFLINELIICSMR